MRRKSIIWAVAIASIFAFASTATAKERTIYQCHLEMNVNGESRALPRHGDLPLVSGKPFAMTSSEGSKELLLNMTPDSTSKGFVHFLGTLLVASDGKLEVAKDLDLILDKGEGEEISFRSGGDDYSIKLSCSGRR